MMKLVDAVAETLGKLAAWMFFAIGIFVTYEVIMRHFFTLPTIWVDEVSRIMQVWGTFIAAAYVLKHREMVIIDVAFKDVNSLSRKLVESFGILVIVGFSVVTIWFGFKLWIKAVESGHTTDTFLAPPKWLTDGAMWVGALVLTAQCVVEFVRVWTVGIPSQDEHLELRDLE